MHFKDRDMNFVVIIPARYQSSRLPGKPLIQLCGVPMVVRTYKQCLKAVPAEKIYVATDDGRIADVCKQNDIQILKTSSNCLTGTDRVAEAASQVGADVYINVQGDEPVFNPADLTALVHYARHHPNEVLNGYCPITDEVQFRSSSIPKVVFRPDGRLLYMSRAAIPTNKSHDFNKAYRQVCVYAFPSAALQAFTATTSKTPLEDIEDIEILRFLELGWEVRMVSMSTESIAVDTQEDVAKAEARIAELKL